MRRIWVFVIALAWIATSSRAETRPVLRAVGADDPPSTATPATTPPPPATEQEPSLPSAQDGRLPTLNHFEQAGSDYGRWIRTPEYGQVWSPNDVGTGWRPYTASLAGTARQR